MPGPGLGRGLRISEWGCVLESGPTGLLMDCPCGKGGKALSHATPRSLPAAPGYMGKLALSTWEWGRRSVQEKSKYLCSKSLPEAKVRPPYLYRETGVWPALWGRGSNDPGNVAKTHYLPHNPIGHLATVLREDLQAIGPLLHPVLLVVCLL